METRETKLFCGQNPKSKWWLLEVLLEFSCKKGLETKSVKSENGGLLYRCVFLPLRGATVATQILSATAPSFSSTPLYSEKGTSGRL